MLITLLSAIGAAALLLAGSASLSVDANPVPAVSQPSTVPAASNPRQPRAFNFAQAPLAFEPNQGQTDPQVKFLAHGPRYALFLTANQAVLELQTPAAYPEKAIRQRSVVRMQLAGSN